ncbi:MAG: circularly permuted type 2 ATP-grasp protein, partial [Kofleriaceae bacterium]
MQQRQSQSQITMRPGLFDGYAQLPGTYDEVFENGFPRPPFARAMQLLHAFGKDELARAQALAEHALLQQGVTFSVYNDARGTEKIFPFCLLPRLIAAADWRQLEAGLQQRLRALGMFLDDIYGDQDILAKGVVPAEIVLASAGYRPMLRGIKPPGGVRIHISGIDLIRDPRGVWRVLEDNLRTPSGVSYVVE